MQVKRQVAVWILLFTVLAGALYASAVCYGGTEPVYASAIKDGIYEVEVESSSSMFRIVHAKLTVKDEKMKAVLTLGGKGYLKLFMGTGKEAEAAEEDEYALFAEDEEGAYTYEIAVEALNTELECAGFSKRKQKWYDHQIVVKADTLPKEALLTDPAEKKEVPGKGENKNAEAIGLDLADGDYQIGVELSGGTGRATILSPAALTIKDGKGTVLLEWSSPNYDYMILGREKFLPVNQEGNSCFSLPLPALNQEITVIADTTAMGQPHEIEYRLLFDKDSIQAEKKRERGAAVVIGVAVILAFMIVAWKKFRSVHQGISLLFLAVICLSGMFFSTACSRKSSQAVQERQEISQEKQLAGGELVFEKRRELSYAKEFSIDDYQGGYVLLSVADGSRFLLVPEGMDAPKGLEENILVLKRPVKQIYLAASAAMDMFCALDGLDALRLSGIKAENWHIDGAREAMEKGNLLYAGRYNMPDYERLVTEKCSLAVENTMINHSPEVQEQLEKLGIPVLIDLSSYESHPLGRTEWIKFYGALLGKDELAKQVFQKQEADLLAASSGEATGKTAAFFYLTSNGAVNVRRPSDYIPKMIALAGGNYVFSQTEEEKRHSSSMNMQIEEFYAAVKNADVLIYNSAVDGELESVGDLLEKCRILKDTRAVLSGNVWCAREDIYQKSMSIGTMINDLHQIFSNSDCRDEQVHYFFRMKEK